MMQPPRPAWFAFVATLALIASDQTADAQVVQLPSIRVFQFSGGVLAPDRGAVSLGGIRSSASSFARRRGLGPAVGPLAPSVTAGRINRATDASASVTIIDLDQIDRQILGEASPSGPRRLSGTESTRSSEDGKRLVRYARDQYRRGNLQASRNGYEVAISVLSGRLKDLAIAEFRRVHATGHR